MKTTKDIFISVLWGAASFIFVFFLLPTLFIAMPDVIWITLCVAVPVLLALFAFKRNHMSPLFLVLGLIAQIALLILLKTAVASVWEISLSGLGAFEYISLFIYPVAETATAFILLKLTNKKR